MPHKRTNFNSDRSTSTEDVLAALSCRRFGGVGGNSQIELVVWHGSDDVRVRPSVHRRPCGASGERVSWGREERNSSSEREQRKNGVDSSWPASQKFHRSATIDSSLIQTNFRSRPPSLVPHGIGKKTYLIKRRDRYVWRDRYMSCLGDYEQAQASNLHSLRPSCASPLC